MGLLINGPSDNKASAGSNDHEKQKKSYKIKKIVFLKKKKTKSAYPLKKTTDKIWKKNTQPLPLGVRYKKKDPRPLKSYYITSAWL